MSSSPSRVLSLALLAGAFALGQSSCDAAGLIWKLPADGTSATYSGTYSQLVRRTDPTQQDVTLTWNRTITIRSVGREDVDIDGRRVPARWIEIEQSTGRQEGGVIQAGPGGRVIVKLLVPESSISGDTVDEVGVPQSFIPIVEGYRQVDDEPVQKLDAMAFDPSPQVTLLGQPQRLSAGGETDSVSIGGRTMSGEVWTAESVIESRRKKVEIQTQLTMSGESPFGPLGWDVTVASQQKQAGQSRDEFIPTTQTDESMKLVAVSDGATSLLSTP